MSALLKKIFERFPGKGGGSRDFVRGAFADRENTGAAAEFARSLL
jgi:hypothetical protein